MMNSSLELICTTCILFLLLTSSSIPTASASHCHKDDRKALLSIKSSLGNPYVIITWGQAGQTSDCCQWVGVDCSQSGRVTGFDISGDNVSGQIPTSIADLPYLTSLTFHKLTNLTGPIPPVIAKLTKLTFLRLDWNELSGPIPAFISQLTSLDNLNLAFNQFSGSIPPGLGKLPLSYIALDRNRLTGPIPDSLGESRAQYLYLSHNSLSGSIPNTFSNNLAFEVIDLSRNKLSGDASVLFGKSKPLQRLDLSRNLFEFDLSTVKLPEAIVALDLNHNKIYGGLSSEFANRPWQDLNVSYNRLCGPIPWTGEYMHRFTEDAFFHNKCLCGHPLSPCK